MPDRSYIDKRDSRGRRARSQSVGAIARSYDVSRWTDPEAFAMSRARDLYERLVHGGEAEVLSFINQPVTEELFLDYKQSADNGQGRALDQIDRNNLAKAISGFGNSEGGVIIWGVRCKPDPVRGDVPDKPVPLADPVKFKSLLEQATSGLTVPPHTRVQHHAIPPSFVVSLIPEGLHPPYQTVPELSYYIRSGSNFARAPHGVLAGLFGRKPQPSVKTYWFVADKAEYVERGSARTQLSVMLRNFGLGIASNVFCNVSIRSHPGSNCQIEFQPSLDTESWSGQLILKHTIQMTMRPGVVIAPEQDAMPVTFNIILRNPLEREFIIEGMCGCADAEPHRFHFRAELLDMVNATDQLFRTPPDAIELPSLLRKFNSLFYKQIPGAA